MKLLVICFVPAMVVRSDDPLVCAKAEMAIHENIWTFPLCLANVCFARILQIFLSSHKPSN